MVCVPTDDEDSFEMESSKKKCVNPAELRIPDDKMEEYLDPKCAKKENNLIV